MRTRIIAALICVTWPLAAAIAAGAAETPREASRRIIVRFRSEGPHALEACAETLFRERRAFARHTADGSTSLDDVNARVGARRVRALFRRPDGRSLAEQRARVDARVGRGLAALRRRARADRPPPDLAHVYGVEIGEAVSVGEAVALYARDPHVAWAQPDHTHVLDALPDDPYLTTSGSWGQPYADLWGLHRVRAPEAWALSEGEGVIVAVVDTGLDYDHPDIAENVWVNPGEDLDGNGRVDPTDWNGVDDDDNGFVDDLRGYDFGSSRDVDEDGRWDGDDDVIDPDPFDRHGHGTHVAGTIAAVANNGIGIAGVAPRATVMPLKGFTDGGFGMDSVLWRAVVYAAANGADVVNNSWSCSPECPVNPLAEEVVDLARAMGVVVVTSAGNLQRDVVRNSPENSWKVVTVASTGEDDAPSASFTNSGWLLDLAAPGGGPSVNLPSVRVARRNILSLRSSGDPTLSFVVGGRYLRNAGTSMASPHVAGVVALLLAYRPGLSPDAVRRILRVSAVDLGAPGHDRHTGAGRLDALAALESVDLPDLDAVLSGPRPGSTFAPRDGPIDVLGEASGRDLATWQLSFGRGNEPSVWTPITPPSSAPVVDGRLAAWDVTDLAAGAYVLRLDVFGRGGHHYEEFLPISLEHARFAAVSSPGPDASAPDVAGRWAVWQSRRGEELNVFGQPDLDLFATDLVTGEEHAIQTAPGDQRTATISARPTVVTWLDEREQPGAPEPWACRLSPAEAGCTGLALAPGTVVRQPQAAAAGRVVWVEQVGGGSDLRACRLERHGRTCRPEPLGLVPGTRALVTSDGRDLVWTEFSGLQRFGLCRLDPRAPGCASSFVTASPVSPWSRAATSAGLLAWVRFEPGGDDPLLICEIDATTGDCSPSAVAWGVDDATPDLSGHRLVWDHHVSGEDGDVFFCEYDRVRARCPVQRLTSHMGVQHRSAIDGRWVVWEDDREGPVRILATELPAWRPIRDRRVREGRVLRVGVHVHPGRSRSADGVRLDAEVVGEDDLAALGMRFVDRGHGHGDLAWRPPRGAAGAYAVTFTATTADRLVTRHTMRIEVDPAPEPSGPPRPPSLLERLFGGFASWAALEPEDGRARGRPAPFSSRQGT